MMDRWTLGLKLRGTPGEKEDALRYLWSRYYPPGLSYLKTAFPSLRGQEEDVLQDCFLALVVNASSYNPLWAPSTWFYTILRRKALDALDRGEHWSALEIEPPASAWSEPEYRWEQAFLTQFLKDFLRSQSEEVRTLFWLRYREGLGLSAISKITGRKVGSLKSDFFLLRSQLRNSYVHTMDQEVPHEGL